MLFRSVTPCSGEVFSCRFCGSGRRDTCWSEDAFPLPHSRPRSELHGEFCRDVSNQTNRSGAHTLSSAPGKSERARFVRTVRKERLDWLLLSNQPHLERGVARSRVTASAPATSQIESKPPHPTLQPGISAGSLNGQVLRRDCLGRLVQEYILAA